MSVYFQRKDFKIALFISSLLSLQNIFIFFYDIYAQLYLSTQMHKYTIAYPGRKYPFDTLPQYPSPLENFSTSLTWFMGVFLVVLFGVNAYRLIKSVPVTPTSIIVKRVVFGFIYSCLVSYSLMYASFFGLRTDGAVGGGLFPLFIVPYFFVLLTVPMIHLFDVYLLGTQKLFERFLYLFMISPVLVSFIALFVTVLFTPAVMFFYPILIGIAIWSFVIVRKLIPHHKNVDM